ncbi:ABC transporter permease subunit [Mycoplasma corogypsi]|uniref:ABC transporter permease subunit n=1 Tax=Mycoplasma corogypsi TaxID=2106 RepID=UPI00387365DE
MNLFLAIESNIRWNTILGSIGIVGIGFFFNSYYNKYQFLGITIFYIMVLILSLELLMFSFNKWVFKNNSFYFKNLNIDLKVSYNYKKWLLILTFIFFVIFTFSTIISLVINISKNGFINTTYYQNSLSKMFNFDFSDIYQWKIYLTLTQQTYVALFLGLLLSLIYAYFMPEKLNKVVVSIGFKIFLSFIKSMPVIIFFFIFNPLVNTHTALIFILTISSFRSLIKQINEAINSLDQTQLNFFRNIGKSKRQIYLYYVLPIIRKYLYSFTLFEVEKTYRNSITYSVFIGAGIYPIIENYQRLDQYQKILPLVLPVIIFFVFLEILYLFFKNHNLNKIKTFIFKLKTKQSVN